MYICIDMKERKKEKEKGSWKKEGVYIPVDGGERCEAEHLMSHERMNISGLH